MLIVKYVCQILGKIFWLTVESLGNSFLHNGHELIFFSHFIIHSLWNLWRHGNLCKMSPFDIVFKQIAHSKSSSVVTSIFSNDSINVFEVGTPFCWFSSIFLTYWKSITWSKAFIYFLEYTIINVSIYDINFDTITAYLFCEFTYPIIHWCGPH